MVALECYYIWPQGTILRQYTSVLLINLATVRLLASLFALHRRALLRGGLFLHHAHLLSALLLEGAFLSQFLTIFLLFGFAALVVASVSDALLVHKHASFGLGANFLFSSLGTVVSGAPKFLYLTAPCFLIFRPGLFRPC